MKADLHYSIRSSTREEAPKLVKLLLQSFKHDDEFWRWRYISNPFLDPSLVLVVEEDGKLIGCGYWLPRDLKVSSRLVVGSLIAAYVIVDSEHRGKGIGTALLESLRSLGVYKKNRSIVCTSLVQDARTYKDFYRNLTNQVPFCDSTTVYTKLLNCNELKKHVDELNQKLSEKKDLHRRFSELKLKILFSLRGAPPFLLEIRGGKLSIEETEKPYVETDFDLILKGDLSLIWSFVLCEKGVSSLVKGILTRSIIVKGSLRAMYRLYRFSRLLRQAFSTSIT